VAKWPTVLLEYWLFAEPRAGTNVVTHSLAPRILTMKARTDFYTASPDALKAMIALETAVSKLPLEKTLVELVKLRASQINGCALMASTCTPPMPSRAAKPRVVCSP
jgi:alkylhydroperoxidase family enzyme